MQFTIKKGVTIKRIWKLLLAVGPGLFCIGYTIGTGSVTSMAKAGSQYGVELLWVLALSCLFSWVLMEAYGRYAVVSGNTTIHSFKTHLKYGKVIAILTIIGVAMGQWFALSGIVGFSAHAIYEGLQIFYPGISPGSYWAVLGLAIAIILVMYALIYVGKYSFFEKVLVFFVTLMGVSFIVSMFIVLPSPGEIARGFIPSIPDVEGATLMVAAFVGTTMAAPTFVVRPLLMKGKGWISNHTREQSRDSFVAALFLFVISGSIMVCATGALFHRGEVIVKVLDMVQTLEPLAGKFAVAIFLVGILSAGLSSIFPILMVAPLLIADYRAGELDTNSRLFRILTGVGCLFGLVVPILRVNPIVAQIATQVATVFILPVVILGITYLINRREFMGEYKSGILLNLGLFSALIFSCIISYTAVVALRDLFGL